jgi:hypothetical protein
VVVFFVVDCLLVSRLPGCLFGRTEHDQKNQKSNHTSLGKNLHGPKILALSGSILLRESASGEFTPNHADSACFDLFRLVASDSAVIRRCERP